MSDKKYAAIQFTVSDFTLIKSIQEKLNDKLGLKLSLAQTVVYCVEQLNKSDAVNIYTEAQLSQAAYEQAASYYKTRANIGDEDELDDQLILRSVYKENQDFNTHEGEL
jgi:hypothetical protein